MLNVAYWLCVDFCFVFLGMFFFLLQPYQQNFAFYVFFCFVLYVQWGLNVGKGDSRMDNNDQKALFSLLGFNREQIDEPEPQDTSYEHAISTYSHDVVGFPAPKVQTAYNPVERLPSTQFLFKILEDDDNDYDDELDANLMAAKVNAQANSKYLMHDEDSDDGFVNIETQTLFNQATPHDTSIAERNVQSVTTDTQISSIEHWNMMQVKNHHLYFFQEY